MWQQIKQVWVTYYTYLTQTWVTCFKFAFALFFIFLVPLLIVAPNSSHSPFGQSLQMASGAGAFLLMSWLVTMAKWHYSHSGARLIPGYRRAHQRLLLLLLVFGCGIYPLMIAWLGWFPPWNMMALMIAIAVGVVWFPFDNHSLISWVPLLLYFGSFTPWGAEFWATTATALLSLKIGILFVGWAMMLAWVWRLPKLDYETPVYGQGGWELLNVSSRWWLRRQEGQAAEKLSRRTYKARIVDHWHDRISEPPDDPRRKSNGLQWYGFDELPITFRVAGSIASLASMFLLLQILNSTLLKHEGAPDWRSSQGALLLLLFPVFMPCSSKSLKVLELRRRLKNEMLFPMSRREMIQGLIRSLSIQAASFWVGLHLALFVCVLVAIPSLLRPDIIATFLLLSLMLQPLCFFFTLWICATFEDEGPTIGYIFSLLATCALFLPWWSQRTNLGDGVFILVATMLCALGFWLGTRVLSAWMQLELG